MGKVRERITDDVEAIAHWVGRKIRNHQPFTARDKGGRQAVKIFMNPDNPFEVRYGVRDGRQFKITVAECEAHEILQEGVKIVA